MTTAPATLTALGAYWTEHGGVNLGIVGNQRHCGGYHLGKDRIYGQCACRPDGTCEPGRGAADYSVQHARDKAGLTNAASAIDLGKLGGSYVGLRAFSVDLVKRCLARNPDCRDIREVIYSPDGDKVMRYSGVDNMVHTGPGNGDLSHRTHTHISYFRDSEKRDKTPPFRAYFELPDTGTETFVPGLTITDIVPLPGFVRVKDIAGVLAYQVDDPRIGFGMPPGTEKPTIAKGRLVGDPFGPDTDISRHIVRILGGIDHAGAQVELAVVLADQVDFMGAVVDCTDAVAAELERAAERAAAAVRGG